VLFIRKLTILSGHAYFCQFKRIKFHDSKSERAQSTLITIYHTLSLHILIQRPLFTSFTTTGHDILYTISAILQPTKYRNQLHDSGNTQTT